VAQGRTLREVAKSARVSLGYLSEVERGQKEASSELLNSICSALDLTLGTVLFEVSRQIKNTEVPILVSLTVVDEAAA
jgi:transcriptional regulator with XRE-family HTH domain